MTARTLPARGPRALRTRPLAVAAAVALALATSGGARADSSYCARARARAGEDAALLMWPRIFAEGYRFPSFGEPGRGDASSPTSGVGPTFEDYQVRIGLSYSVVDLLRGVKAGSIADADCRAHEASTPLRDFVESPSATTLPALRAQAAALEVRRPEWNQLVVQARERLRIGVITSVELESIRRAAGALERRLTEVRGEIERLEAVGRSVPTGPIRELTAVAALRAMEYERASSGARALDALQLRVSGGVIPGRASTDWFARVEVSYALGALGRGGSARDYLRAREDELVSARYELPTRVAERLSELEVRIAGAERTRRILESDAGAIRATLAALEGTDAPGIHHARAAFALERFATEAEQAYVSALIEALAVLARTDGPRRD